MVDTFIEIASAVSSAGFSDGDRTAKTWPCRKDGSDLIDILGTEWKRLSRVIKAEGSQKQVQQLFTEV